MFLAAAAIAFQGSHEVLSHDDFSWVDVEVFGMSCNVYVSSIPDQIEFDVLQNTMFEPSVHINDTLSYKTLIGVAHAIGEDAVYEFVYTSHIKEDAKLRLLFHTAQMCICDDAARRMGYILNGQTGEIVQLCVTHESARQLLRHAVVAKNAIKSPCAS